jgi:FkbM family methyltransferase
LGSTDVPVLEEIFCHGNYHCVAAAGLASINLVVDLGANVGMSVRFWNQHYPAAKVIAVEPDPTNMALLALNVEAAQMLERVKMLQAFVGGALGEAVLVGGDGEWACRMAETDGQRHRAVRVLTMREVLDGERGDIDLLKCDIEGSEREVFQNCASWISRVRNLVVEVHRPYTGNQLLACLA